MDKRRVLEDGTCPIKVSVGHGTGMYYSTGIHVKLDEWDERTRLCIGKSARQLNAALESITARVQNRILELRERGLLERLTKPQLRQMLEDMDLDKPLDKCNSIGEVFSRVIDLKNKENTRATYISSLQKLRSFCDIDKMKFEDITPGLLRSFVAFMEKQKLRPNTQRDYLFCLRHVVNFAYDEEITTSDPFRRFRFPRLKETRHRALDIEDFRKLLSVELPPLAACVRDLFLLSFCLIGINMADLRDVRKESIIRGRLEYERHKTGRLFSILIQPEAEKLLPVLYELQSKNMSMTALQTLFSRSFPKIAELAELSERGLTWYWARHSWATYAAELDIPDDTISRALGHKRGTGAAVTATYIKANNAKVDEANRRVIDYAFYDKR